MTAAANVGFPLRMRKVPRAEADRRMRQALEIVRLTGLEDRYPRQLSGGQQQRVALARTLVFNPSVVLMDEPLGALDRKLREHMQVEIKQIQRRLGITVVYVTHDQEEALTLSDRIGVMRRGRLEQLGTPADLYERPRSRFVADFIGESNFLPGRVAGGAGDAVAFETRRGAKLAATAGPGATAGAAVLFVRPEKIALSREAGDPGDGVPGTVRDVVYVGESCRYHVELDTGDTLIVKQMNAVSRATHAQGDRVTLAFRSADAVVFPEEPQGEPT
jgi:ABC-type Fe3+/spermidine/putrescine transport system ATPase subunit